MKLNTCNWSDGMNLSARKGIKTPICGKNVSE